MWRLSTGELLYSLLMKNFTMLLNHSTIGQVRTVAGLSILRERVLTRHIRLVYACTEIYKNMGTPVYMRTMEEYADLVRPWKADANGFIPLLEWHGIDQK